jgi:hypothetical protein
MTDLLKIAGDALSRIALGNLLLITMTISRHPLTAGRFGKYPVNAVFRGVIASGYPVIASRPEAIRHAVWLYLRFPARVDPNLGFSKDFRLRQGLSWAGRFHIGLYDFRVHQSTIKLNRRM